MSNTLRSKSRPLSEEVLSPNKKSKSPIVSDFYVLGQMYVALVPKWVTRCLRCAKSYQILIFVDYLLTLSCPTPSGLSRWGR